VHINKAAVLLQQGGSSRLSAAACGGSAITKQRVLRPSSPLRRAAAWPAA
jgi:hypothetical protein